MVLKEAEKPVPNDNQVLVKIMAASVNPLDWHFLRGDPYFIRFMTGFPRPKQQILGVDMAGIIEAVGKNVKEFKLGDEVFGAGGLGAFAEYVCKNEDKIIHKPAHLNFAQAAAIPVAGLTALQGFRKGKIQAGQKVLIIGAAGGVGSFAVQIAKSYGAQVTGVCSTKSIELVRSLGADNVIDYTKKDYTKSGQLYDLILDNASPYSISSFRQILTKNGVYVGVGGGGTVMQMIMSLILAMIYSVTSKKKFKTLLTNINKVDLKTVRELIESGKVKIVIDRTYPFEKIPDAIRYLEEGHARGKVVIEVAS
ncbi:MAG TPA: NAD(P)-dependent alcohol dehydrogenase [candidate division Zixibacteria bacterium]|nr:NAD(P)-dependent alcohol dehydrogenase [candidate division Zixibacteria bacterium]